MKPIFLFVITLISIALPSSAQQDATAALESKIEECLHRIDNLRRSESKFRDDSLQVINARLMTYLKKTCSRQSGLLQDEVRPTDSIGNPVTGMNILTSEDNKLRIYCWDTWTGKSQHSFNALAQIAAKGNATRVKVMNDIAGGDDNADHAGTYFTDICTVHTLLGKTVYLLMDHKVYGNKGGSHAVHSYEIDKGSLIPVPIFKTNGKLQNTVAVEHDLAPYGEWAEDDANIKLSDDKKTMFVPLLKKELPTLSRKDSLNEARKLVNTADSDGALKGDYYIYRFDGFHFVYDKEANKGLKQQ